MDNVKALIAKSWKNELLELEPGTHYVDECITIHVTGSVERKIDQLVLPTVSIPLIPTLAFFLERCHFHRDMAITILREAIVEALSENKSMDQQIEARMDDIQKSIESIKNDLLAELPKQKRKGRVLTKGLNIEVVTDSVLSSAGV